MRFEERTTPPALRATSPCTGEAWGRGTMWASSPTGAMRIRRKGGQSRPPLRSNTGSAAVIGRVVGDADPYRCRTGGTVLGGGGAHGPRPTEAMQGRKTGGQGRPPLRSNTGVRRLSGGSSGTPTPTGAGQGARCLAAGHAGPALQRQCKTERRADRVVRPYEGEQGTLQSGTMWASSPTGAWQGVRCVSNGRTDRHTGVGTGLQGQTFG